MTVTAAGAALAAARARRDAHYPDAAAAAADAAHTPAERDQAEAAIRALWADAIADQSPAPAPPGRAGHAVGA